MANLSSSVLSLPNLAPGSTDSASVKALQSALLAAGYLTQQQINTGPGIYGPQTTAAVAKWQSDNGVNTNGNPGYFGPASKSFIQTSSQPAQSQQTNVFGTPTNPYQNPPPQSTPSSYVAPPYTSGGTSQALTSPYSGTSQSPYSVPAPTPPAASGGKLDPSILNTITSNLGPGANGTQVQALQQALVAAGYLTQQQMNSGPGIYGPQTTAAVAKWQAANGIPTNGNAGYFGPVSKNFIKTGTNPDPNAPIISPVNTKGDNTGAPVTDPHTDITTGDGSTGSSTGGSSSSGGSTGGSSSSDGSTTGGETTGFQNTTLASLPNEAFAVNIPMLTPGTPEYQAAIDKLSTAYYDVMQQQMNASTQEQQQAAEYNWQTLKSSTEQNLGISLSNNALNAWDQIQQMQNQSGPYTSGQNIQGSGMQQEQIDKYLQGVRLTDAQNRTKTSTSTDSNQMSYYQNFATPDQIKALVASDPAKAKAYGLVPSSDVANAMNAAALKAKYPNMSDADIQANIATVLDENGNYRSGLYQKYMAGSNLGINPGQATVQYDQYGSPIAEKVTPTDSGILDINAAKNQYLADTIENQNIKATNDYDRKLGSTPTTAGKSAAGGADTTLFNTITPPAGTQLPSNPQQQVAPPYTGGPITPLQLSDQQAKNNAPAQTPTMQNPVPTPGQTTQGTNPSGTTTQKTTTGAANSTQNNPLSGTNQMYTVKRGDTLSGLYGSNWQTLSGYKGDPMKLQIGAQLPKKGMIGQV